jgi:hypothetical protein
MFARSKALEASERSIAASIVSASLSVRTIQVLGSECSHGSQLMVLTAVSEK